MKKRVWLTLLVVALLVVALLLSGCGGDKKVVDSGGVGRERDIMIIEAAENTRAMDQQ